MNTKSNEFRDKAVTNLKKMQTDICDALENLDQKEKFITDTWSRTDANHTFDAGGGITRVITDGNIFEKGGVNFSEVFGTLPEEMSYKLVGKLEKLPFYATGTSLVIHPTSPQVPTIHANIRYLEVENKKWVGGGIDLTPYTYNPEIFKNFHNRLKQVCDEFNLEYYSKFKKECDQYFRITHRNEARGIGGVFFDYLGKDDQRNLETYSNFAFAVGHAFNSLYVPIVEATKELSFSEEQKEFQLIRRGRYTEFNLIYDRGTLFGLKTGGRIESILMSLPKFASWQYDYKEKNEEQKLMNSLYAFPPEDWSTWSATSD
jgi:coproporphyrinogen III oxidase